MLNFQKGFTPILLFLIVSMAIIVGVGGYYLYTKQFSIEKEKEAFPAKMNETANSFDQGRMESTTINKCDLNGDDECDAIDQTLFKQILGKKRGDLEYNPIADADFDGIITSTDEQMLFPTTQSTTKPSINSGGISPQEDALNQPLRPAKVKVQITGSIVKVSWSGTGADIIEYEVSRKNVNIDKWKKIGSVKPVNDNLGDYEFIDKNITSGSSYIYGVNVVGLYNNKSQLTESNPVSIP